MTYPEVLLPGGGRRGVLTIALVLMSLLWDAPLEGLADPMHTPNPAKAPWYFLGLQELLHYFPPVVAGVLIPTLVVIALIVIPYFNINIEAEGLWLRDGAQALADLRASWWWRSRFSWRCSMCTSRWCPRWWWRPSCSWRRGARRNPRRPLPPLAGLQAAVVLDHDLVPVRSWRC